METEYEVREWLERVGPNGECFGPVLLATNDRAAAEKCKAELARLHGYQDWAAILSRTGGVW